MTLEFEVLLAWTLKEGRSHSALLSSDHPYLGMIDATYLVDDLLTPGSDAGEYMRHGRGG